jgi:hypothetical protein
MARRWPVVLTTWRWLRVGQVRTRRCLVITDQGVDPRFTRGSDDPRLNEYDGILPGFSVGLYLPESQAGWIQFLRAKGYDVPSGWSLSLRGESERPFEDSLSGFLTTRFLEWLEHQESGWFAHLSYLRPHSPYSVAGSFSSMHDPADVEIPIAPVEVECRHPLHRAALQRKTVAAPSDSREMRTLRAQCNCMISEVDAQLGRVARELERRREWDDTLVIVTSDHGDQGLLGKLAF